MPSWRADAIPHHLDDYVAQLILKRSKADSDKYEQQGISAYLDQGRASGAPLNTNKRFLGAVLRNVEGHNQSVIKQQLRDANRAQKDRRQDPPSSSRGTDKGKARERDHEDLEEAQSSKMDKYFQNDYDPAKDISVDDLIAGEHAGWDRMFGVLSDKDEAKRKRKEERDRIRREREERRKSRRSSKVSPDRSREHRSKHRHHKRRSRSPKVREWDLGKPSLS